jgi:hypothetical protein
VLMHHHQPDRRRQPDRLGEPRLGLAPAAVMPLGGFIPREQYGGAIGRRRRLEKFDQPGSSCIAP